MRSRNSRDSQLTPGSTPVPTPAPVPALGKAKSNKHKFLCVRQFEEHVEEFGVGLPRDVCVLRYLIR